MPKVQAAILSDVVYIREGLVYLLAGGINRVTTELPGSLNVALTVMVELEATEFGTDHRIDVKVVHAESTTRVGEASDTFGSGDVAKLGPGEPLLLPLVVSLKAIPLPMYGPYDIHVNLDGEPQQLLTFRCLPPRR